MFDSVSVATTFQKELKQAGVIFMPISEAIREHPELVKKYLGTVVPTSDNFFATLNSAVFSDGSFVYVPKGVRCPMELSTYFRINAANTGQFERTLIVADEGSYVSYLEGCTAPIRDENQLHAAVVDREMDRLVARVIEGVSAGSPRERFEAADLPPAIQCEKHHAPDPGRNQECAGGAVILGKTSLSEWANFRSSHSSSESIFCRIAI